MKILGTLLRGLRNGIVAIGALAFVGTAIALGANYTVTQGSGTTFASLVISTVNYAANVLCDATAGTAQCAAVNSSGQLAIAGPVTNAGTFSTQLTGSTNNINNIAGTVSLPTGAATASNQSTANTSLATIATNTGSPVPLGTASGVTPIILNAMTNSAKAIKGSAGQLFMLQCGNTNSTEVYVQIYNIASGSVTVGTSTPTLSIPIAATGTGGFTLSLQGLQFGTAISAAATTTATGGTAPSTALDCNAGFN